MVVHSRKGLAKTGKESVSGHELIASERLVLYSAIE